MQNLDDLKKRIKTTGDLLGVVKTMKSLAAVNIRHFERAALSLTQYAEVIDQAWAVLLRSGETALQAGRESRTVILVMGSDQGMCGQFNEQATRAALRLGKELEESGAVVTYWTVGDRVRAGLRDTGREIPVHLQVPGTLGGIDMVVGELISAMAAWHRKEAGRFHVIYNAQKGREGYEPLQKRVLPLDRSWREEITETPWDGRCLPQTYLPMETMFANLFEQHLFVSLYGSLARSMAAENSARLNAMQAAEKNIEEMRSRLQGEFLQTRQNSITEELLDIVAGVEAMTAQPVTHPTKRNQ